MLKYILYGHKFFLSKKEMNNYKHTNCFLWLLCEIIRRLAEYIVNIYIKIYAGIGLYPNALDGNADIVVSLTSFGKRINIVWGAIDSMFHQKIKPSKIYLYLSREEFPNERKDLPKRLLAYEKLGLEICFRDGNLMSHKKYYYALQEHGEKCIVTIDDDVYYHNDTISSLWQLHCKYPNMVCTNKKDIIKLDNSTIKNYKTWSQKNQEEYEPSHLIVAIGYGGVLYPPLDYGRSGMFNIDKIKECAPRADDLWLKAHEILCDIKVASTKYTCEGPSIGGGTPALQTTNRGEHGNDIQWNNINNEFRQNDILIKLVNTQTV